MSLIFEEVLVGSTLSTKLYRTKLPTGWLVTSGSSVCFVNDPMHLWVTGAAVPAPAVPAPAVPAPAVPAPAVPAPAVPAPAVPAPAVPAPAVPAPAVTEEYQVIYDDSLKNGWKNFSWASVDTLATDSFEGKFAISVDADNWSALNFASDGFNTNKYHAIDFAIKAKTGNPPVQFSLNSNYKDIVSAKVNAMFTGGKLPTTYETVRILFSDLAAPDNTIVTNLLFKGSSGLSDPFMIDSVRLVSFPDQVIPDPLPEPTPKPVTPIVVDGWLSTSGNKIKNSDGTIWQGRGVNIFDTRSCSACYWNDPDVAEIKRRIDYAVQSMNVDFFRLCAENTPANDNAAQSGGMLDNPAYLANIKDIVKYCGTKGTKVLLSLWVEPTTSPNDHPTTWTTAVWKKLAGEFLNDSHVMFGCVNEPTKNWNGSLNKSGHAAMQDVVNGIRNVENAAGTPHHIIAVQGLAGWARDVSYYVTNPIVGDNIAYETHFYDPYTKFDKQVVIPSQTLPMIVGELGPRDNPSIGVLMTLDDCQSVMTKCDELGIPFLGWALHMRCPPNMLVDNSNGGCGSGMKLALTNWGNMIKGHLAA